MNYLTEELSYQIELPDRIHDGDSIQAAQRHLSIAIKLSILNRVNKSGHFKSLNCWFTAVLVQLVQHSNDLMKNYPIWKAFSPFLPKQF